MLFEKSKLYKNKLFNSLLILICLILIFIGKLDLIALRNGSGDIQQIGARPYGNYNMVTSFGLMFNNSGNKLNFEKDPSEGNKIRSIDREVKYAYIKIDDLVVYTDPEYSFKNLIDPTENPPFEAIGLDGPTVLNINGQKYAKIVFFNTNNTYNIKYHPERVLNKNIIWNKLSI